MSALQSHEKSIICFAGNDWWLHNTYTEKQWMRIIARHGYKILFVNSIGIGMPSLKSPKALTRIFRKFLTMLRWLRKSEGVWVLTPFVIPLWSIRVLAGLNVFLLALQTRIVTSMLRMRRPVLWTGLPTAGLMMDRIPHGGVVYFVQDYFPAYYETMLFSRVADLHERVLSRANAVIYASIALYDMHKLQNASRHYIPHGVGDQFFRVDLNAQHPVPPEMRDIPHPIVGYWGALESLQDRELVSYLARRHPEWSLVFIGRPMYDITIFKDNPNVHFLGYVEPEQLPEYGIHFDVAVITFLQHAYVTYACPIKMREYYALGKPVVATPILEIQRQFPDAGVGGTPEDFERCIIEALGSDTPEKRLDRRRRVADRTWPASADQVMRVLDSLPQ
jgi:glycosyltransferase involved in cell wall biosynthesis